jgi:hypothetical protein
MLHMQQRSNAKTTTCILPSIRRFITPILRFTSQEECPPGAEETRIGQTV